jgi:hypothetical protein
LNTGTALFSFVQYSYLTSALIVIPETVAPVSSTTLRSVYPADVSVELLRDAPGATSQIIVANSPAGKLTWLTSPKDKRAEAVEVAST